MENLDINITNFEKWLQKRIFVNCSQKKNNIFVKIAVKKADFDKESRNKHKFCQRIAIFVQRSEQKLEEKHIYHQRIKKKMSNVLFFEKYKFY